MFMQLPVLLKIAVVFFVIVFASSRKLHLGLAAALGGIAFALWSGLPFLGTLDAALAELTSGDTLLMLALMTGIMAFSAGMKKAGAMDAFARSLCELVPSRRVAMAAAPLFIGTLPMPGGAILSAPLVDAMDPRRIRGSDTLTAANYWFRHCLELAWPLYPAFILTSSLSGLGVGRLMALNAYAIPLLFMLGLLFILPAGKDPGRAGASKGGPVRKVQDTGGMSLRKRWRAFAAGAAPLAMVLGVYVALDIVWKLVSPSLGLAAPWSAWLGRYAPILLGLAAGSGYLAIKAGGKAVFKGCVGISTLKLVAVVAGIRVFSALLGAAGAAEAAAEELAAAGIPLLAAVALLPFVAGLVTGVGFGYVGLAFPILLGLVPAGGAFPRDAAIVLGGAFGYAGMMLSPLHVCMVVSAAHFGTGLPATIRRFALPLAVFVLVACGYVALLAALA